MHRSWTQSLKRPAGIFACALAMSLFLTGAFFVQQIAYEESSREAAAAAERVLALKQRDYDLRFHAEEVLHDASLTRRKSLERNATELREAESAWLQSSTKHEQLSGMSAIWSFSLISSFFSGLLLALCMVLMGAGRLIDRLMDSRTDFSKSPHGLGASGSVSP